MEELADIDLGDPEVVDVQIAERRAVIDRLHAEVDTLERAASSATTTVRGE